MPTESLPERAAGPPRPDLEPRRGTCLGRYELLAPLASGGMAHVWIARLAGEHGFARLVAVKTMRSEHAENEAFRRMFLDEARLAARIAHANAVEVLDLGEDAGVVYLAMALVEGNSLSALMRLRRQRHERPLPLGVSARIVADALCGLHAAHELTDEEGRPLQLVHRDVSPHNVLVGVDGVAKIADFGIAKARWRLADETDAGQVKGKFAYMAPEQVERREVDRRADLFASGVVLWEALTGQRLFGGVDLLETLERVRREPIPDPRAVEPSVPAALADVTLRALERDPAARFRTAAEMSDAIDRAIRASDVATSTKEVGALVAELCAEELERRREAVRDAVRAVTRGAAVPERPVPVPGTLTAATTTVVDPPAPEASRRTGRSALAIAGAIAMAGAAAVGVAIGRRAGTGAFTPASVSAPASVPASVSAPAAVSGSESASAQVTSAKPAPPPRARPRPAHPAPVRPKYGNPYGP